jgi:hypothetical protein
MRQRKTVVVFRVVSFDGKENNENKEALILATSLPTE